MTLSKTSPDKSGSAAGVFDVIRIKTTSQLSEIYFFTNYVRLYNQTFRFQ